ncbi:DMT family transporter [Lacibacterium aquatile]|uniref:DMT family transporter n=1 Tax=Lacibacterium aquatile TaxID=1168082 RepID=A0ABW5DN51_9PROT
MVWGILAGLTTCALWGLTYVVPRMIEPFNALDLTVLRYVIFGLASVAIMAHPKVRRHPLTRPQVWIGLATGVIGYLGFFLAAAYAVQLAGAAIPPLMIGAMPVLLAVIANYRDRTVSWGKLALPMVVIAAGVLIVNVSALRSVTVDDRLALLLGIFLSVISLAIWVAYGLVVGWIMKGPDAPNTLNWTGIQGIGAAVSSLFLLPLTSFTEVTATGEQWLHFGLLCLVMGLLGAWFATWCWGFAARRLPLALSAQLIVAETVFGLVYGFLYEERWPDAAESIGAGLQLFGMVTAIAVFSLSSRVERRKAREAGDVDLLGAGGRQ